MLQALTLQWDWKFQYLWNRHCLLCKAMLYMGLWGDKLTTVTTHLLTVGLWPLGHQQVPHGTAVQQTDTSDKGGGAAH